MLPSAPWHACSWPRRASPPRSRSGAPATPSFFINGRKLTGAQPFEEFKKQLEERVYIDSAGFLGYQDPINTALRQFPDSQVLFGTDSPFGARDVAELVTARESIERAASNREADAILGGNAARFLGLDTTAYD